MKYLKTFEITDAQKKYISKKSGKLNQTTKDIKAANKMFKSGKSEKQIIAKYGEDILQAMNAYFDPIYGVNENSEKEMKYLKLFETFKRKWKPSATQRREFAKNMQDLDYKDEYYKRKEDKAIKRREKSRFDYDSAGGKYVPTKIQYDFVLNNRNLFKGVEEETAANEVQMGYVNNDKINHDYIHIINDKMRKNENYNVSALNVEKLENLATSFVDELPNSFKYELISNKDTIVSDDIIITNDTLFYFLIGTYISKNNNFAEKYDILSIEDQEEVDELVTDKICKKFNIEF